jgi:hypothetical protein
MNHYVARRAISRLHFVCSCDITAVRRQPTVTAEIFALLGCYVTQRKLTVTDVSGQTSKIKMGPIGCPETSAPKYESTLRNNPED